MDAMRSSNRLEGNLITLNLMEKLCNIHVKRRGRKRTGRGERKKFKKEI
jgi:hypothetical protein